MLGHCQVDACVDILDLPFCVCSSPSVHLRWLPLALSKPGRDSPILFIVPPISHLGGVVGGGVMQEDRGWVETRQAAQNSNHRPLASVRPCGLSVQGVGPTSGVPPTLH